MLFWVIGRWGDFYTGKGERRNEGYGDIRENQKALWKVEIHEGSSTHSWEGQRNTT